MQVAGRQESISITWEKLPDNFPLPDDPVENLYHPLQASGLREILEVAALITAQMLVGSNFGICANVNGRTVVKAPDWFYVPNAIPVASGIVRRSYTPHTEGDIPAIVMEFLSDTDQTEYSAKSTYPYGKWFFYEQILKVPTYIIFNHINAVLEVHDLVDGHYQRREQPDANGRYYIEALDLYLGVWHGEKVGENGNWLRWWDKVGNMLPWTTESVELSLEQGRTEGIQQGIEQRARLSINRLIKRKFGNISGELQSQINCLDATLLDELEEVLFDFNNQDDLANWLIHKESNL
jgi:Uma2 family endonuclease